MRNRAVTKARKRQRRREQMLPGVPSYQGGGDLIDLPLAAFGAYLPQGPNPYAGLEGLNPAQLAQIRATQDAANVLTGGDVSMLPTLQTIHGLLGQSGVADFLGLSAASSGGGGAPDHYGYDLQATMQQVGYQIERERLLAENAQAQGNLTEQNRHNQTVEMLDAFSVQLQQQNQQQQYGLGLGNLNLGYQQNQQQYQLGIANLLRDYAGLGVTQNQNTYQNALAAYNANLEQSGGQNAYNQNVWESQQNYNLQLADYNMRAYQQGQNQNPQAYALAQAQIQNQYNQMGYDAYNTQVNAISNQQNAVLQVYQAQLQAQLTQAQIAAQGYDAQIRAAIATGDFQMQAQAEMGKRAALRQSAILDQHQQALQAFQQQASVQAQGAGQLGDLASAMGAQQNERSQYLGQLAANPRDFPQLYNALSGGQGNFVDQLLSGRPIGPQGTGLIGDIPTYNGNLQQLIDAATARPDLPVYQESIRQAMNLINMQSQVPQAPSLEYIMQATQLPPMSIPQITIPGAPQFNFTPGDLPQFPAFPVPPPAPAPLPPLPAYTPPGPPPEMPPYVPPPAYVPPPPFKPPPTPQLELPSDPSQLPGYNPAPAPLSNAQMQLTPEQYAVYQQFIAAAPNVDEATAIGIAQRPGEFLSWIGGAATGGTLVSDDPAVLINMRTGKPMATMFEPTKKYPQGIPEMLTPLPHYPQGVKVTPLDKLRKRGKGTKRMATGGGIGPAGLGSALAAARAAQAAPLVPDVLVAGGANPQSAVKVVNPYGGTSVGPPPYVPPPSAVKVVNPFDPPRAGPPPACPIGSHWEPTLNACIPDEQSIPAPVAPQPDYLPTQPGQCRAGFHWDASVNACVQNGKITHPRPAPQQPPYVPPEIPEMPALPSYTPPTITYGPPTVIGGGSYEMPPLPPLPAYTPPPPMFSPEQIQAFIDSLNPQRPPAATSAPATPAIPPGEAIRRFMAGLDPKSYYRKLLPSQFDFMSGAVSALGVDPRDFYASVERMYPRGVDPNQINYGTNFSRGGYLLRR